MLCLPTGFAWREPLGSSVLCDASLACAGIWSFGEIVPEAVAPTGVARLPPKFRFHLAVRGATDPSHHRDPDLAHEQAGKPGGDPRGWPGANDAGELGQPDADRRRLVVN